MGSSRRLVPAQSNGVQRPIGSHHQPGVQQELQQQGNTLAQPERGCLRGRRPCSSHPRGARLLLLFRPNRNRHVRLKLCRL